MKTLQSNAKPPIWPYIMGRPPKKIQDKKQNVSITLSPSVLKAMDKKRKGASRSRYIENAILKTLAG